MTMPTPEQVSADVERITKVMSMVGSLATVAECDAARDALIVRWKECAKAEAAALLPTFKVGDTVVFRSPNPMIRVPVAGIVKRVGTKMNLDIETGGGVASIPVVYCRKVQG